LADCHSKEDDAVTSTNRIAVALTVCVVLAMTGCASVPKEAVTLSYRVGDDIQQLQSGYRETVRLAFDQMRENGMNVIDNVWTPAFLSDFIVRGKLIESAQHEEFKTQLVEAWARLAIGKIEAKRKEFLDPLQKKEDELLAEIDAAFDQVISANATVTAHLNSVVKVKGFQDQLLERAGLKDIRDSINSLIVSASELTAKATNDLTEAAKKLDPPVALQ